MTLYYHVSLEGVSTEQAKIGKYQGHTAFGVSIFKSARAAKRKFCAISIAEIRRLQNLRREIRPVHSRKDFIKKGKEFIPKEQLTLS